MVWLPLGSFFADELTEWLLEVGFILSKCQMSIYYKYSPDGCKSAVLSYVDDFVYCYTNEDLGKKFVHTLAVSKYFETIEMVYPAWSTEME